MTPDPYAVLGVRPGADAAQIRAAYRRLVKLHHPDHNGGDPEAARRFEEVQEAYAAITQTAPGSTPPDRSAPQEASAPPSGDPSLEARLADLERQVHDAHAAREAAERVAREAAAAVRREAAAASRPEGTARPSDEELGYVHTDDSLAQILTDARAELADRVAGGREHPVVRRVNDLIEGLESLADKLDRRGH